MPELDFKVKKRHIEFWKNQLLHTFNAKLCMARVNHGLKTVVGVVDDHQKKFQPLLSISCFAKKNNKNRWIGKNNAKLRFFFVWKVILASDSFTPPSTWRSHNSFIVNHVYSAVLSKMSNFDWLWCLEGPKNIFLAVPMTKK